MKNNTATRTGLLSIQDSLGHETLLRNQLLDNRFVPEMSNKGYPRTLVVTKEGTPPEETTEKGKFAGQGNLSRLTKSFQVTSFLPCP